MDSSPDRLCQTPLPYLRVSLTPQVCARVPLAMDATLLADLIEYRKDRDKAVVAAARSLLQLFRDRMPALLHKKYRGKGCDLGEKPDAYGALQVATGVEGAELLSAREARLAAAGKLRRDEDGGPEGEGDTDDGSEPIWVQHNHG